MSPALSGRFFTPGPPVKSSDTLLSNFMFKSLKRSLIFVPHMCVNSSLKIFIFESGKCWGKRQDPGQFEGAPHTTKHPAWVSLQDEPPPQNAMQVFPQPAPGPGLKPPSPAYEVQDPSLLTVPRAPSSSPTPFLCCPLQPHQTLPPYVNIHKALAYTSKLQSHTTTTP